MSIHETINLANERWPNLDFRKKNDNEACSPCPFCTQANEDGFLIFADGGFWCRQCKTSGKIVETVEERLTKLELQQIAQQAEIERVKREQEKQALQLKAIETMLHCTAHIAYHENLPDYARDYWHEQGINDTSIERWKLGYTQHVPLWQSKPGYSIPIINNQRLRNIRYRLVIDNDDKKTPKYLPHVKHLPITLFNADRLIKPQDKTMVILGEGEKKVIVAEQFGFPVVGILGTNAFKKEWVKWFMQFLTVYVCLDSDAMEQAAELALLFGSKGRVVELPDKGKLDDCFNDGMSTRGFCELLRKAKGV